MKNRFNYSIGLLIVSFILMMPSIAMGQIEVDEESECARILDKAQKTFEDGLIEKVEQMILPCLQGGQLTKEETLQGYRLLTLAKLYENKDEEAEAAMLQFLKTEPEYQLQAGTDPKEFGELFDQYHTSPLYTIGFEIGTNYCSANSYLERGVYNTVDEKKQFESNFGFQVGLLFSRYIYGGFNVHLGLLYVQNTYSFSHSILEDQVLVSTTESQTLFSAPLTFSYTFLRDKKIKPYISAGAGLRIILSAEQQEPTKSLSNGTESQGSTFDVKEERNNLNFEGIVGAGLKYKITRGDLFLDFQYQMGINNQRNEDFDGDINDDGRLWDYYVSDNNFTLNNLAISVGYTLYLYKPRKKKEK